MGSMQDPFSTLAEADRRELRSVMRRRRFGRGEVVCHEGDPGDSLHVVEKGRFVASVSSPLSGQALAVNLFTVGDLFGELAVLGELRTRTATVTALTPAETLELRRADFERVITQFPSTQRFLLTALAERVREMTTQLAEAVFTPVDRRLFRRVLLLHDVATGGQEWITVRQEDLAMLAGTTRATVNRFLRKGEESGVIELGRGRLRVLDRHRLERMAS